MNNKINNRDSNIELLRIFSMILIICFHYIYKSNFQYNELTFNNLIIKSGWFLGELGVNLFILITGYYLCKSKPTIKKTILLIIQIIFYNLINYVIGYSLKYNGLTDISLIFPIITKKYWFITAYLLVYILSPYCNKLINKLTKREFQKFLLINLVIWCLIPTIFGFFYNTTEELLFYNRFIWLLFMYFIGSYIRIYNIKFLNSKKRSLLTSSLTFLLMIISIIILYIFKSTFTRIGTTETAYFWTPNNILMFVLSIATFMFFTKLKIKNNILNNNLSSTTLGIYLLHDGQISPYMWKNIYKSEINIYNNYWFIHVLITTILIFIIGFIIDTIRQFIEKHLIKKIIDLKIWKEMYKETKLIIISLIDKLI